MQPVCKQMLEQIAKLHTRTLNKPTTPQQR
jgi:hypothetical protein